MSKAIHWTPQEDKIITQYAAGYTAKEINALLPHRSIFSIYNRVAALRIRKRQPPRKNQSQKARATAWFGGELYVLRMYQHLSPKELNEKLIYRHTPDDIVAKKIELGLTNRIDNK